MTVEQLVVEPARSVSLIRYRWHFVPLLLLHPFNGLFSRTTW